MKRVLVPLLVLITAAAFFNTLRSPGRPALSVEIEGIMGTDCRISVISESRTGLKNAPADLKAAGEWLAKTDITMSDYLDGSEIGQINSAGAEEISLSKETLAILNAARNLHRITGGAFDITCRPLVELWKKAGRINHLPSPAEIAAARAASNWDLLNLRSGSVVKKSERVQVDLGGIAKGYAIDRALGALKDADAGYAGGIVEAGGDLRCFGTPAKGELWTVSIKDPFRPGRILTRVQIPGGAVCTSGGYYRFASIEGKRYSHIIDPRTGRPAENSASTTVLAPDTVTADAWATALSVLGPEGLKLLEKYPGIEAMIISGTKENPKIDMTEGFRDTVIAGRP